MGEYVEKEENMNFKDLESLKEIGNLIKEADEVLKDKNKTIADTDKYGVLKIVGAAAFSVPAAMVSIALYRHSKAKKAKELQEAKECLYKEAIKKQTAILKALQKEACKDKKRIETLNAINSSLTQAVVDLSHDLGK